MKQSGIFYKIAKNICRPFCKLLYRYKYINRNSLPKDGSFLLVGNHLSYSDPILLGLGQKRYLRFMAKSELFNNKFFGFIISKLGAFPVKRGAGDGKAINKGEEILENGGVVTIFFEGTRSKTGEFLRPRSGAAMISYATNTPIVPVCITPVGKKWLFSKRYIHFGDPITPKELGMETGSPREFRDASRKIMEKLQNFREQDINDYNGS